MAYLQIARKDTEVETFEFEDKELVTCGRASDNDIVIKDASVSGHHCEIERDGTVFTVKDLGATNTTRLNNTRITEARVNKKDIIMVGSIAIMLDGDGIDEDGEPSKTNTVKIQVGPRSKVEMNTSTAFATKKSYKGLWIAVIVVISLCALVAAAYFIKQMTISTG